MGMENVEKKQAIHIFYYQKACVLKHNINIYIFIKQESSTNQSLKKFNKRNKVKF